MSISALLERTADEIEARFVGGSTLTRVLRLMGRPDPEADDLDIDKPFAILTAFISGSEYEANQMRLRQMRQVLDRAGLKTFRLSGNWTEESPDLQAVDTEQTGPQGTVQVKEEAIFCTPKAEMDFDDFSTAVVRQADYFDQVAILLSDGQKMWIRFKDGHLRDLGERVSVDSIQQAYQQMRDQREHTFIFE